LNEITLLIKEQVLRERVRRVRTPLRALTASLGFEIALSALCMMGTGRFLFDHVRELRFVWPAALMDLWFWGTLVAAIRQLVAASRIQYDQPIATVQGQLEALRILRLKFFRWLFLTGQIVWWIPFGIVAARAAGIDIYRFVSTAFLVVNLLIGLALIPTLSFLAKRIRFANQGSWYERLADSLAGRSLSEARRQAKALADFQQ
jgi:hypothetical protein